VENGAACYNYRAYNTTTWGGDTAPDVFLFAISAGRTNTATLTLREPTDNGGLSYTVLDPEIVNDLASGAVSGLFIANFSTPQVNLNFTRTSAAFPHLSYGIPISRETGGRPMAPFRIDAAPNPFSQVSAIRCPTPSVGKTALAIYAPDGRRVEQHANIHGELFHWIPKSELGNGTYIIRINSGDKQYSKPVVLNR
jgi:hypothetical protein